mmetsp:Transcript_19993/g.37737  ORF Transcript_19993/g.37737 Transcript_19993/m.37737 type:complete len:399 (+) Transcript_19993:29-1225(+)
MAWLPFPECSLPLSKVSDTRDWILWTWLSFFMVLQSVRSAPLMRSYHQDASLMHAYSADIVDDHEHRQLLRDVIVNGSVVENASQKYAWYALPTREQGSDIWIGCGASIISAKWAISAAHCFGGGANPCTSAGVVSLWLGDVTLSDGLKILPKPNGRSAKIDATVICHPDFDGKCSHGHDLAMLRLHVAKHNATNRTKLPHWVKVVRLDLEDKGHKDTGQLSSIMGFGKRESDSDPSALSPVGSPLAHSTEMREVKVTILDGSSKQCNNVFAGGYGCSDTESEGEATSKDKQLCAGPTDRHWGDTCNGDSGSPMLDKHRVQIGIVSYGGGPNSEATSGSGRECGDPNFPRVYTKISAFADFIRQHANDLPYGEDRSLALRPFLCAALSSGVMLLQLLP